MNEALKWFLFEMSAYLSIRDGSAFSLTNIGVDIFKIGKYVRGNITGVGAVIWDKTGRLVYPTSFANGSKNLVLKLTAAQMVTESLMPEYISNFLETTSNVFNNYAGGIATVNQYLVGVNKNLLSMNGISLSTSQEWSPSGDPLSGIIDHKLGLYSEISNYKTFMQFISPNYSATVGDNNGSGLETVVSASGLSLNEFFADLNLFTVEYRGTIGTTPHTWDGSGNHSTDLTLNIVDIVTNTDFQNNY